MNRIRIILPIAAMIALLAGCTEDTVNPMAYNGTNGVVADDISFAGTDSAKEYKYLTVDFVKSSVEYTDPSYEQRMILMGDTPVDGLEVELQLALPSNASAPGDYAWGNGEEAPKDKAYAVLSRDEEAFTSVSGTTTIVEFGDVGKTVVGTFSGIVKSAEGKQTHIQGRFTAQRLH